MITTVIGSYPKPDYLKITDWFKATGGTDTKNPTKYYEEEIENRILDALNYIDKQQLIAAPDCGLGHLPRQLAIEKLKTMVCVAKNF